MKPRDLENARNLARYHLQNQEGSARLAKYVFELLAYIRKMEALVEKHVAASKSVRRIDRNGQDVTDAGRAAWSESDFRVFTVRVPQFVYEELNSVARKAGQSVQDVASLTIRLGQQARDGDRF